MVLTLANLSDRYSGTRLFTILNIKDFSCFARLSARLFHLFCPFILAFFSPVLSFVDFYILYCKSDVIQPVVARFLINKLSI